MTWNLFIDDQANEPNMPIRQAPEGFLVAKSTVEAKDLVIRFGMPRMMDLDFDLGLTPDGKPDTVEEFLKWLWYEYLAEWPEGMLPEPPNYVIHSQNVEGRKIIDS